MNIEAEKTPVNSSSNSPSQEKPDWEKKLEKDSFPPEVIERIRKQREGDPTKLKKRLENQYLGKPEIEPDDELRKRATVGEAVKGDRGRLLENKIKQGINLSPKEAEQAIEIFGIERLKETINSKINFDDLVNKTLRLVEFNLIQRANVRRLSERSFIASLMDSLTEEKRVEIAKRLFVNLLGTAGARDSREAIAEEVAKNIFDQKFQNGKERIS